MRDPKLQAKSMLDDLQSNGWVPTLEQRLKNLIASLDKICSACLASVDQHTHELLHRGRSCPNKPSVGLQTHTAAVARCTECQTQLKVQTLDGVVVAEWCEKCHPEERNEG